MEEFTNPHPRQKLLMTTEAITPLRQRMIEDMTAPKLSAGTQRGHILSCKRFAARLHAGCRLGSLSASPKLIPEDGSAPRFWHRLIRFRHFCSGSLALASLNRACRNLVPTFPQRSPPSLLTTAACGGLRSAPDCRPRRVDEDVAILIPHSPGRAGFPLPVLHGRVLLAKV